MAAGRVTPAPGAPARTTFPRSIGRPATAALALAGYDHLEQLHGVRSKDLLRLHGVGPTAVARLRDALAATGRALLD